MIPPLVLKGSDIMSFTFNRRIATDNREESTSFGTRVLSDCIVVAGILALGGFVAYLIPAITAPIGPHGVPSSISTNLEYLPYYSLRSVLRMAIALLISLVFSLLYGLAAARSRRAGKVLIPLLDILQSVPILGFLSITVPFWLSVFPGSIFGVEAASIFSIFTSQAWNMTFSFYRSLNNEPTELDEAARSLRLTKWQRFWTLDVPNAIVPMLWNCMMSVSGGWFFLTASEMISVNNRTYALPGIGSFVAQSAKEGNLGNIGWAILAMVIIVLVIDLCVWKPLTAWAEKFRITQSASAVEPTSIVLTVIRQSHLDEWLGRLLRPLGDLLDLITRPLGRTGAGHAVNHGRRRAGDLVFNTIIAVLLVGGVAYLLMTIHNATGFGELAYAFGLGLITFMRVVLLIIVCSLIWVPIGAIIGMNPRISRFAQPIVQVMASFPANFIFPIVTLWFVAWHINIGWGSILLMALGTQWYILFNVIAGASQIPNDLIEMSTNMGLSRWMRWKTLILPAVFSSWCTGGITAAGGAWNASIVSEIISYRNHTLIAKGIGSYITQATATGDMTRTLIGVAVMSVLVVAINRLFWNPLERLASRRFALSA